MSVTITSHFSEVQNTTHVLENEVLTAYFYDTIVVVEVKEGKTLSYKTGFTLLVKGLTILGNKPWVYISNRINSYSVQPNDYKYINKIPTLKGIAVVSPKGVEDPTFSLESTFCKKPFVKKDSLEDAYQWAQEFLSPTA
ncbi:hypothetical protein [Altibacter sp. HG106]|uniref:hypothetical protein n=1 Tax=Altibacter sp. HG106 TaxID=3023937 RepID=UPI002350605C|nr:hypothetical protein [Altibacter sp. HG106]MDC7995401.1 hypothetical protein [Altibacter sp. HG106]